MSIAVARSRAVTTTYAAFRNLLHNGAMQVAQRSTSVASVTSGGYRTVDRWNFNVNGGTWTISKTADRPSGTQFTHCTKVLCTTAKASLAAGDYGLIYQSIEGQNLLPLLKGTASAQTLTASFWVKSNVTGTYIVEAYDYDNNRQVSKSYTINAADTWEKKIITFPADTTGVLDNDANRSFDFSFWYLAGSTFTSGTLNSSAWASNTNANRAVGIVNLASATNNYFQVTGVQLEVGSTATPFENIPFDVEQTRCQRYYIRLNGGSEGSGGNFPNWGSGRGAGGKTAFINLHLPTRMRVAPTTVNYSGTVVCGNGNQAFDVSSIVFDQSHVLAPAINPQGTVARTGTGTIGNAEICALYPYNDANAYLELSADL